MPRQLTHGYIEDAWLGPAPVQKAWGWPCLWNNKHSIGPNTHNVVQAQVARSCCLSEELFLGMLAARTQVRLSRLLSRDTKYFYWATRSKDQEWHAELCCKKDTSGGFWVGLGSARTGDTMSLILLLAVTIRHILNLGVLVSCLGQGERQPIYLQSDERTEGSLADWVLVWGLA